MATSLHCSKSIIFHCFDQAKIGASQILNQPLDIQAGYAFIGISGPEIIRKKITWIREESSRAGEGPSIISVEVETGILIIFILLFSESWKDFYFGIN